MSDEIATVGELKQLVENFVSVRDWEQFHTPKNLSMAISIEASELMDLFKWHGMMFLDKPILDDLIIGDYRKSQMKVVSGRYGKQRVHFEAPCLDYQCVGDEMNVFLNWLKSDNIESGYIKAAIAKFYFVTIHPFDDGNGRFSRMIAERCLADAENTNIRLYSLSNEME